MFGFKKLSIKRKLIAIQLVTTFIVLTLSFVFDASYDLKVFSQYVINKLASTARLISSNSASALTFLDNAAAEEVLASLEVEDDVVNAWIYDRSGELFARYSKEGYEGFSYPKLDTCHKKIEECYLSHSKDLKGGYITVSREITEGNEILGMLSLRLNVQSYKHMFMKAVFVTLTVLLVGMIMAYLLSSITQKKISQPILKLADAGKQVIATGDYSVRVEKEGEDEIGGLYDDFNELMDQVHVREMERDKAYESVRESEKNYRYIVENINDGMWIHDFKGTILDANENACELVGHKREEVIGSNLSDYSSQESNEEAPVQVKKLLAEGSNLFDAEIQRIDGIKIPIMVSAKVVSTAGDGKIQSFVRDITERKLTEESLLESEQKYRTLFDNMNDGFAYHKCIVDGNNNPVDYVFLEINSAFEKYTGLKGPDIIGKKVTEVIPGIEKAEPNLIKEYGRVAQTGENINFEMFFEPFDKWYAVSAYSPEKGFFCAMFKDITERKKAEELAQQHQERLIQTDKMTTLGILVSGVAHEINNPNNFMLLNSNNLADIWKDLKPHMDKYREWKGDFMIAGLPYSEVRDDVDMLIGGIVEGTGRIKKIVASLKNFARKDPGDMDQPVNINTIVESSLIILSNLIKKSTDHLSVDYAEDLPLVKGNSQQIEQVVINLISNACQALENKTKAVSINTASDPDSKRVFITVKDQGTGISAEDQKHIMDPFFTTKRDSGGTGLGLSISYTIIKDLGGELKIESEQGTGTTAAISLPCA
ncbi:PAS domain S-box protein [Fibrobacterota bacterium]